MRRLAPPTLLQMPRGWIKPGIQLENNDGCSRDRAYKRLRDDGFDVKSIKTAKRQFRIESINC